MDQIHEQNNKIIKGAGGASDLLNKEDDSALLRWEVCSPELARVILEFEDCLDRNDIPAASSNKHRDYLSHKLRYIRNTSMAKLEKNLLC